MRKDRIYLDTSVIGGVNDDEFSSATISLFKMFKQNIYIPVISLHTLNELIEAPEIIRGVLDTIEYEFCDVITEEMEYLADKYIHYKIVTPKYKSDALHVAISTVLRCDLLVSWNFKHIVHYEKMRGFNRVNQLENYGILFIKIQMR